MYYLQIALLALGAVLLSYNFLIPVLCAFIFLLITWKNKNLNARKAIILVIVFLAFFIRGAYIQKNNVTHLENRENIETILVVDEDVQINGNYLKGVAKLNKEKVLFYYILKTEDEKNFFKHNFEGGRLKVRADIEDIKEKKNFYSFDYKKYNEYKGIFKNIKVNDIEKIEKNTGMLSKIKSMRLHLVKSIRNNVAFDKSGYIEALVFGEKTSLEKDEINNFKNLGTSHLLAISGLHLGVLIGLIYFVLQKIRISVEVIEKIVFVIIPIYMLISGLSPSVLRAGMMIMIYIIFRKKDLKRLEALLVAFILMVFVNPLFVFDIGFELSFLITFCLLMAGDFLKNSKNTFFSGFKISVVSSLASLPLLVTNFYTFSYVSIISNVVLVPLFSMIIFPLVLVSYVGFLISSTLFNSIFRSLLNFCFGIFDKVQDIFLNFVPLVVGHHSSYFGILLFIIVLVILIYLDKKNYLIASLGLVILIISLVGMSFISGDKLEELKLGKTSVHYVRDGKKNLLINTSNNVQNFYDDFRKKDVEYDIINEYNSLLNYEGKSKFDYLLLTSSKKNVVGYADNLIGKKLVRELIVVDKVEYKLKDTIELAKFSGIKINILEENKGFKLGKSEVRYNGENIVVKNKEKEFKIEVVD